MYAQLLRCTLLFERTSCRLSRGLAAGVHLLETRTAGEQTAGGAFSQGWKGGALPPAATDHPPTSSDRTCSGSTRLECSQQVWDVLVMVERWFWAAFCVARVWWVGVLLYWVHINTYYFKTHTLPNFGHFPRNLLFCMDLIFFLFTVTFKSTVTV
jgi:hypothetical protein